MKNKADEIKNNFLGANVAIVVSSQEQVEKLIEFMSIKNLFLEDGNPVRNLNLKINTPIAFFRNYERSYIDYDNPSLVEKDYALASFDDVFVEQTTLFGNEGVINPNKDLFTDTEEKAMDAEAKETVNELSLLEVINRLEVESVTPAAIEENITEYKEMLLKAVKQYSNIVVTEENYKELTATRADLNKKKDYLVEQRKKVKKEASKQIDEFFASIGEVIKAIEGVVKPLDEDIKKFDTATKEKRKEEMMNGVIRPLIDKAVSAGMITQKYADMFIFDNSWLNASAVTKTGNLTAKTKEAVNNEFNRVLALYQQSVRDIETIKSTILILSQKSGLEPGALNPDTYVEIYEKGKTMPEIQQMLNDDIERLTKAVERQAEKKAQKLASKTQTSKDEVNIQNEENASTNQNIVPLMDEKTGEIVAKYNGRQILAEMAVAPAGYEDKEFSYTYSFSGPCAVIMTLNRFLKLLSKVFPQFKYERLGK